MSSIFGNLEARERFFLRNLVVYPLTYKGWKDGTDILSLDEAMQSGVVKLKDIYGVNSIGISNSGSSSVLLLEGESLSGARQDRILNVTAIVEPETETVLPVSCVEQNRWNGSGSFSSSITLAFPSLRSILRSSVSSNLKTGKKYEADQNAIWEEVKSTLKVTKTKSMTLSIHDAYDSLRNEIDRYMEERGELNDVQGYMVFSGDSFVSIDIFASQNLLKKYERKLFESYAMQGILFRYGKNDLKKVKLSPEKLKELDALDYEAYDGAGSGIELRYSGEFLIEISLDRNERFVYASVLPSHV